MRVSIAIDNSLYYQTDIQADNVQAEIKAIIEAIAGSLWDRVEWYTDSDAGVIIR
jgi:ribonuclease HI